MSEKELRYENIVVTPRENSEIEITGAITALGAEHYRSQALKKMASGLELPGFRKGHVPEGMAVKTLGETAILEEAAQLALQENYPRIVLEQKLAVIGEPHVQITKLALSNPIEFKITTAVMPEVVLPDYKALAKKVLRDMPGENTEATDKEVDDVILQLRENKWRIDNKDAAPDAKPGESDLPELTLDLVKTLGDFASLDAFKAKIKENIGLDKERKAKEKRRGAIGEQLIKETAVALPRVLVESELHKMLAQFKHDVAAVGMPFEEYLKKIHKNEEDLKKEWTEDAQKRAVLQLALNAIAEKENIVPEKDTLDREVAHILSHHRDAQEENVRIYVATLLRNEHVFQLLEDQQT